MNNLHSEQFVKLIQDSRKIIELQLLRAIEETNRSLVPSSDGTPAISKRFAGFDQDGEPIYEQLTASDYLQSLVIANEQLKVLNNIQELTKKDSTQ